MRRALLRTLSLYSRSPRPPLAASTTARLFSSDKNDTSSPDDSSDKNDTSSSSPETPDREAAVREALKKDSSLQLEEVSNKGLTNLCLVKSVVFDLVVLICLLDLD